MFREENVDPREDVILADYEEDVVEPYIDDYFEDEEDYGEDCDDGYL